MTDPAPSLSSNPTVDKPIAEDASGAVSMSFDLERSVEVLERTPKTLAAMLRGVSDFWAKSNYGPDTFSPFDVVGHLIEGEKHNWIVRAKHILEHGDRKPFAAFDRYAMYTLNDSRTMDDLLTEFALRREAKLAQLLASWVVHDLGHTHQIAKAMAYQYRDAVGPWVKFLTILPRP
jgi:hypothetical protein